MVLPSGLATDEIFIEGMPVGHFFGFVWNLLISMSFQFVGFLLTYLLASTHAARCGSRAGLGVILIQYGFYMRDSHGVEDGDSSLPIADTDGDFQDPSSAPPPDNAVPVDDGTVVDGGASIEPSILQRNEWISYVLVVVGWFILLRAFISYYRVRKLEAAVRDTPQQTGSGPAVVAEDEGAEAV